MPDTLCNTAPMQYLFQLGQLELLPRLYGRIVLPHACVLEIGAGLRRGVHLPAIGALDWADAGPGGLAVLPELMGRLGAGECEAITLAAAGNHRLVMGDALARKAAEALGLRVSGTLGILLRAKREGHLAGVAPPLDRLHRLGFRLHPRTRTACLRLAGEQPSLR